MEISSSDGFSDDTVWLNVFWKMELEEFWINQNIPAAKRTIPANANHWGDPFWFEPDFGEVRSEDDFVFSCDLSENP